jgi:hypothetical protein
LVANRRKTAFGRRFAGETPEIPAKLFTSLEADICNQMNRSERLELSLGGAMICEQFRQWMHAMPAFFLEALQSI